jgi:hypothetical protein
MLELLSIVLLLALVVFYRLLRPVYAGGYSSARRIHGGSKQGKSGPRVDHAMQKKARKAREELSVDVLANVIALLDKDYTMELVADAKLCREVGDIPRKEKYESSKKIIRTNHHNGQLKLLLTEIQFLTLCLARADSPATVVYAGSAPSNKLGILLHMFPRVKFVLVDPNEHLVMFPRFGGDQTDQYSPEHIDKFLFFRPAAGNRYDLHTRPINLYTAGAAQKRIDRAKVTPASCQIPQDIAVIVEAAPQRVFIIEDLMTNELAELFAGSNVLFVSDIRTTADYEFPGPADIIWNNSMHYCWIKRLKPARYMLKYHPPYAGGQITLAAHTVADVAEMPDRPALEDKYARGVYHYLAAEHIFIQAFAPPSSTEVRLIGSTTNCVDYDIIDFEDKMYYYNTFHRNIGRCNWHAEYVDFNVGIDRCADCGIMCSILAGYYSKFYKTVDRDTLVGLVRLILASIDRKLTSEYVAHASYELPRELSHKSDVAEFIYMRAAVQEINPANYIRHKSKPTLADQLYKINVAGAVKPVLAGYELTQVIHSRGWMAGDFTPDTIYRTISVSLNSYDLFGNSQEFRLDLTNKLCRVYVEHAEITEKITAALTRARAMPRPSEIPPEYIDERLIAAGACRELDRDTIILCSVATGPKSFAETYKSRQLDGEIDAAMAQYSLAGVTEINVTRITSYFDCSFAGYTALRNPGNTTYTNYSIYGGGGQYYPGIKIPNDQLIILNLSGISQIMAVWIWRQLLRAHPAGHILTIGAWNMYNGKGKMMLDKTASKYCSETISYPLYVNYHNISAGL